jgi:hypothetical protein
MRTRRPTLTRGRMLAAGGVLSMIIGGAMFERYSQADSVAIQQSP